MQYERPLSMHRLVRLEALTGSGDFQVAAAYAMKPCRRLGSRRSQWRFMARTRQQQKHRISPELKGVLPKCHAAAVRCRPRPRRGAFVGKSRTPGEGTGPTTTANTFRQQALTRTLHTPHETPTDCSRRRKEADASPIATFPPPYVGGYEACEISGLATNSFMIFLSRPASAPFSA